MTAIPSYPRAAKAPLRRILRCGRGIAAFVLLVLAPIAGAEARSAPSSFADLAAKATPSVVNISTLRRGSDAPQSALPFSIPEGSPYADLFRRFWEQRQNPNRGESRALGSGFIVDAAGYIATNNHVIDKADEITVTLHDGRQFKAKVVGTDKTTDLALLKIEKAGDLPAVAFGDSDKTRVGDWVMAVGNPFNLGGTVTVGVLSARNRDLRSGPYDDYLQIDAPINRGNSGGPLFNLDGEVIGINTAIFSPSGGNIGIGFAIPSAIASKVLGELRENGRVERGWLGVYIQPMNADLAKTLGLDSARGALVAQVQDDSPAKKAGLMAGDVILALGDRQIEQARDLARFVADVEPGKTLQIKLWRARKEVTVEVKIEPLQSAKAESREPRAQAEAGESYGLMLAPLDDSARERLGMPAGMAGVLVGRVVPGGAAAEQGLRAGDVIVAIGGEAVTDMPSAVDKLDAAKKDGRAVLLLISRRGVTRFVVMKAKKS